MKLLAFVSFILLSLSIITSCSSGPPEDRRGGHETTETNIKQPNDSAKVANLKAKKTVTVGDKTIEVVDNASTTNKLKFEYDGSSYKSLDSEREQTFLSIRIKLSSKSKFQNNTKNFLPALNIFRYNPGDKMLEYLGKMEYLLYKKDTEGYAFIEQLFDYEESGIFVCHYPIPTPIISKYIISVAKGGDSEFNSKTVIGIIEVEKK